MHKRSAITGLSSSFLLHVATHPTMLALILLLLSCAVGPLVFILYNSAKPVETQLGSSNVQTRWAQRFNLVVGAMGIVPTFIRVYAVGVTDTITTALWRRGVSGTLLYKDAVDQLIQSYDKKDRVALVTGTAILSPPPVESMLIIIVRWRFWYWI